MSTTGTDDGLDDDIDLVKSRNGWFWVDTDCDGPGTEVVEEVDIVEYAVTLETVNGVKHLQIAGVESNDGTPELSSGRAVQSSHWYDLDEMR